MTPTAVRIPVPQFPLRLLPALAVALALFLAPAVRADVTFEERLELAPGGTFRIDTDLGAVTVTGDSDDGVVVVVRSDRDDVRERFEWTFRSDGTSAEVRMRKPASQRGVFGWFQGSDRMRLSFEVRVPTSTDVEIDTAGGGVEVRGIRGSVLADTSGGGITVTGIEGDVEADTSGGGIRVEDVLGNVRVDTSGGGIDVARVDGRVEADTSGGGIRFVDVRGDQSADTSGGPIEIEGAGGRVLADTSGGRISVAFLPGNDRGGVLDTSGGGIVVRIDPSVGLEIDASASAGSVVTDLPLTVRGSVSKRALRGTLNGGGATLELRASGGGIRIEPL